MDSPNTDPYVLRPTLTPDGRPWVQRCYVCRKGVNLLHGSPDQRVRAGELVRHKRCRPGALR